MSRMTILDSNLWLFLAGEREPRGAAKTASGYPPYNIELMPNGETMRITFAVAGFGPDELEVMVEDGALIVSGRQRDDDTREYLHRGIAARQFKRSFVLASGVEVGKAELHNGLLAVDLVRPRKEKRVQKVGILTAG
ncbi:Hsp20 family protein [Methyloceanibacter sp.]|uniref:Hsp20 family protein n=1 Tax=Methyloceanibacter sp. TaxID=1965321 RepID=UPI002D665E54|nr:Hsp20 family protein [Methyloceanibacter sp.]HZP09744.1 Hsp20 family protein [Methyloceanibacter sp.]